MKKLPRSFYLNNDVLEVARSLVGKRLCTKFHGTLTSGIITETEAYCGVTDRASHAYAGRRTKRTEMMFREGGIAYVYICYGIHALFNVVTNLAGIPHAVLVRAIRPDQGVPSMLRRRNLSQLTPRVSCGPGTLTMALGIRVENTGLDLLGDKIWIETAESQPTVISSRRIGVDYAGEDAKKPWRFLFSGSEWISRNP